MVTDKEIMTLGWRGVSQKWKGKKEMGMSIDAAVAYKVIKNKLKQRLNIRRHRRL